MPKVYVTRAHTHTHPTWKSLRWYRRPFESCILSLAWSFPGTLYLILSAPVFITQTYYASPLFFHFLLHPPHLFYPEINKSYLRVTSLNKPLIFPDTQVLPVVYVHCTF